MDIISTNSYPSNSLSNFAAHPFTFRGFEVNSMEGFLQGLKFKSPEMQAEVFKLVGRAAKKERQWKELERKSDIVFPGNSYKKTITRISGLAGRSI